MILPTSGSLRTFFWGCCTDYGVKLGICALTLFSYDDPSPIDGTRTGTGKKQSRAFHTGADSAGTGDSVRLQDKAGLSLGSTIPALERLQKDGLLTASEPGARQPPLCPILPRKAMFEATVARTPQELTQRSRFNHSNRISRLVSRGSKCGG